MDISPPFVDTRLSIRSPGMGHRCAERINEPRGMEISVLSSVRDLPPKAFPHRLLSHARGDELAARIDQIFEQVLAEAEPSTFALLRQLDRTQHLLSLELPDGFDPRFQSWLEQSLSLALFPDGTIVDSQKRTLYSAEKPPHPEAQTPRALEAVKRRERTQARLRELAVPSHLPLTISERELNLRPGREVAERCLALLLVALRAESASSNEPIPTQQFAQMRPLGTAHLTPQERDYLENPHPKPEADLTFGWRFESLLTLLWSLGLQELPPPSELGDVSLIVEMMLNSPESDLIAAARPRDPVVLLDTLDLIFCQHWLLRQAESEPTAAPPVLAMQAPPPLPDPGVIYERHYALSWLTRSESSQWDDIATPLGPSK